LTPKVVRLAQAIYDERTFDRLPALAVALEEAGCFDSDKLSHCRMCVVAARRSHLGEELSLSRRNYAERPIG
jgi:hypothetical protein